jgi:hypothetical protein
MSDGLPDYDTLMERRNHYVTGISVILGRLRPYTIGDGMDVPRTREEDVILEVARDLNTLLDTEVSATDWVAPRTTCASQVIPPRMTDAQPVAPCEDTTDG